MMIIGDETAPVRASTLAPQRGQAVSCRDGPVGRVVSTRLGRSGQLRAVTVRLGRIWRRDVDAPAAWIEGYDGTTLRLGIERRELTALPSRRSDADTAAAARLALEATGILRTANHDDVSVTACDGTVSLSGYVGTAADRLRAEGAVRQVPGVREMQDDLVADDDLVNLVAQALANDERTRRETIFVAASHGVVILSGLYNSAKGRSAAEACAGQVSSVRGVSNYIEAPDTVVDAAQERVLQPRIGQEVLASDMSLGRVEQVIINRENRRVVGIVVRGRFPDRKRGASRMRTYELPMTDGCLTIPAASITFVTSTVVQLSVSGLAAAGSADLAPGDFVLPNPTWHPPYPYTASECLWARS